MGEPRFVEHQCLELTHDFLFAHTSKATRGDGGKFPPQTRVMFSAGTVIVITMVYSTPWTGYELEFCGPAGETLCLTTMSEVDLLLLPLRPLS